MKLSEFVTKNHRPLLYSPSSEFHCDFVALPSLLKFLLFFFFCSYKKVWFPSPFHPIPIQLFFSFALPLSPFNPCCLLPSVSPFALWEFALSFDLSLHSVRVEISPRDLFPSAIFLGPSLIVLWSFLLPV